VNRTGKPLRQTTNGIGSTDSGSQSPPARRILWFSETRSTSARLQRWFPETRIWLIHWQLSLIRFFTPARLMAILPAAVIAFALGPRFEVLALRHQLDVLQRSVKGPMLTAADRFLWARLSRFWTGWRSALVVVKPETVIAWHRKGFRVVWTWKVHRGQPGRPAVSHEIRKLIRLDELRESAVGRAADPRRTA
jgi:hypothetical protein